MNRRGFLAGILATGVAPAVISSGVLMSVRKLIVPEPRVLIEPLAFHPVSIQLSTPALRAGDVLTIAGITRGGRKNAALELFVVTASSERDGVVTVDVARHDAAPRRLHMPKHQPWPRQGRWA